MLTRLTSTSGTGAPLAAITLAFLWPLMSGADGRVHLEASVFEQSRGRDVLGVPQSALCASENPTMDCREEDVGKPCAYCTKDTYTVLQGAVRGGFISKDSDPENEICGRFMLGTCDQNLVCNNAADKEPCGAPVKIDQQGFQVEPPDDDTTPPGG